MELYVLNKSNYSKISELKNQKIALYDNGEEEFISSIKELEKKITFKEKKYSNIDDAVNSLINEETKGLFLNSSLMDLYLDDHHIENQIRSIESIDLKIKTESELKEVNVTKKPFVVYLSGIDTSGKVNKSARSDVNLAAVVNPKSGKILIISIPRDYYVTLDSKNAKDKLTHAGIYGVLESAKTVGNLLDTEVNYYARVNFTSFIKIIDTIDGISVNVEKPTYRYNGDIDCGANRVCEQNSKKEFANKFAKQMYVKMVDVNQFVSNLSGGNKQKVVLARWIGKDSDIVVLDSPTRGIDIKVKQDIYQLMNQMRKDGKSIIMISEEPMELIGMCDRIMIMKDGKISGELERDQNLDENGLITMMV